MKNQIHFSDEAITQINEASDWWHLNRLKAPSRFDDELQGTIDLLAISPKIGAKVRYRGIPGLRKILLPVSRYHLYYVHYVGRKAVLIVFVWSAVRGKMPRIKKPELDLP